MKAIRRTVETLKQIPAKPSSPYPYMLSWLFSLGIMFTFIYVCEVTGM